MFRPSPAGIEGSPSQESSEADIKAYLTAAALHQTAVVQHFIEALGLHPDASYKGKPTALCYAVLKPHHDLMDYLLGQGADVGYRDAMAMTPLHYAALGGCCCCLARLIAEGAPLNAENCRAQTPLALTQCRPELCSGRSLLEHHGAGLAAGPALPKRFH